MLKVGVTGNALSRLKSLRAMCPIPCDFVALMSGGREEEQDVHARWAEHRAHGEWFRATPEMVREIRSGSLRRWLKKQQAERKEDRNRRWFWYHRQIEQRRQLQLAQRRRQVAG